MNKSAFNIPNSLTVIRVLVVPFFIYCLFQVGIVYKIIALAIFILASVTDFIDGYLARKWNQETEFGKFLDPLADKILVVSAFAAFIILYAQIEVWMVLLIILRDMLITSLRYLAIIQGSSMKTSKMGKVKTAVQMISIILILFSFIVVSTGKSKAINQIYIDGSNTGKFVFQIAGENFEKFTKNPNFPNNLKVTEWIDGLASFFPYYIMLITTIITVLSGIKYLLSNYYLFKPSEILKLYRRKK
ncbi:MAG: CDP-diacylglycerol--glycerol-3-phosphate 3-phosphatidyltransferase [Leptospiraceae bacterium]|nr:CDP-diacylglycerol--glycerol-3-phosphate 3-phosphatidyltransferase [Leptospiraceae bacterium]MCP5495170.1 CDP-diacylglycerol--glycerol-3-phosphate 3-phosphatidyltransferase [Leptospiraceae bacterium]